MDIKKHLNIDLSEGPGGSEENESNDESEDFGNDQEGTQVDKGLKYLEQNFGKSDSKKLEEEFEDIKNQLRTLSKENIYDS